MWPALNTIISRETPINTTLNENIPLCVIRSFRNYEWCNANEVGPPQHGSRCLDRPVLGPIAFLTRSATISYALTTCATIGFLELYRALCTRPWWAHQATEKRMLLWTCLYAIEAGEPRIVVFQFHCIILVMEEEPTRAMYIARAKAIDALLFYQLPWGTGFHSNHSTSNNKSCRRPHCDGTWEKKSDSRCATCPEWTLRYVW